MIKHVRNIVLLNAMAAAAAAPAGAQAQAPAGGSQQDGEKVTRYPTLVRVPLGIGIDVNVPPVDGSPGGGATR